MSCRQNKALGLGKLLPVMLAALVAGCVTGSRGDVATAGPRPENYVAIVSEAVRQSYFDPYSLRDTMIGMPVVGSYAFQNGWVVCFQANGKNRMGAYTGIRRTGYVIRNGAVVAAGEGLHRCLESDIVWQTFAVKS